MKNIAIIFAGGVGQRMGSKDSLPKQFLKIYDKAIIVHTLERFQNHELIDEIYIAIHKDYLEKMNSLIEYYHLSKVKSIVVGGSTAQDSIYKALKEAHKEGEENIVLINDGVRPNITDKTIKNVIESTLKNGTGIACTSCFETVLLSEDSISPSKVPYRKHTYSGQAPQGFYLNELLAAHEEVRKTNPNYEDLVDSCTLFKALGKEVFMVEGNRGNIKITTLEDLYLLRALITYREDKLSYLGETDEK